ncbi:MAG: BTAD domain-containing putative transcriptional regulator [Gammaproteobacteria bacterium]
MGYCHWPKASGRIESATLPLWNTPTKKTPLLANKITPPQAHEPILRARLFERLDEFVHCPIVWLVGAPGSGKTTLANSYLSSRRCHHLWYQLDASDADISTFFHYFRQAVKRFAPRCARQVPILVPENLPGLAAFLRRYSEILKSHVRRALIVLDNYEQLPKDASIQTVIRELSAGLAPEIRLLVLSRIEPPAAFAKLRVHGDLVVFGGTELNLTLSEARTVATAYATRFGTRPDFERVEQVHNETRGWVAGFTLVLRNPTGQTERLPGLSSPPQLLFDYFATELFVHFKASVQRGLLLSALLPVMTIPNLDRLTNDPEIARMLEDLHRGNCFVIRRGESKPVYEFHALFRAFLLDQALARIPPGEWRDFQKIAADLLAASGEIDAAAELFQATRDWEGLAALALREGPVLISAGRHHTLDQWLRSLPIDLSNDRPWLDYWHGIAHLPFDPVMARTHFERAYTGFDSQEDVSGLYASWSGIMDTFFYEWQDLRPADRWIAEFESLTARYPEFPSREVELHTDRAMGTMLHRQPQHPFVSVWAVRAEALLNASNHELSVLLGGYLVIYHLWRGDSAQALDLILRLNPRSHRAGFPPLIAILWSCATGLYYSVRGDLDACLRVIDAGLSLGSKTGIHCWDFLLAAQAARCSLVAGNLDQADAWITRMAAALRTLSHISGGFLEHLRSNFAAQHGDWVRAAERARKALAMATESGVPFLEAHCRIDLARALIHQGDTKESLEHLGTAETIGRDMQSRVLVYLCLETRSHLAFEQGDHDRGTVELAQALAVSRAMGEPIWQMTGPKARTLVYERALTAGIETDHVQRLIRSQKLLPSDPNIAPASWPWPVRVYTLGHFEILCDDELLRSTRKAQQKPLELIKILCAFGGNAVHQDRVAEVLWPDAEGDVAEQDLNTTLHRLRKLLQLDQGVRLEGRRLSLDSRYIWIDALAFDRIARDPLKTGRLSLQCALQHYRGHFLEGESAQWIVVFRERLRSQFLKIAEQLGMLFEQEQDWPAAIACYRRVIEIEPVAESFYRRLMNCHSRIGQRVEAMNVFQCCRRVLLTQLGVSPTPETQALYQQLVRD